MTTPPPRPVNAPRNPTPKEHKPMIVVNASTFMHHSSHLYYESRSRTWVVDLVVERSPALGRSSSLSLLLESVTLPGAGRARVLAPVRLSVSRNLSLARPSALARSLGTCPRQSRESN